jgi:hypothetical protein
VDVDDDEIGTKNNCEETIGSPGEDIKTVGVAGEEDGVEEAVGSVTWLDGRELPVQDP